MSWLFLNVLRHGKKKCGQVAEEMYGEWAKGKDVQSCPRCRARIWKGACMNPFISLTPLKLKDVIT